MVNGTLKLTIKNWELYFNENTFRIDKKLVASAGSDNRTKFLQLRSNDQKLNEIVVNRFWGNFLCRISTGILLREFKSPNDWPKSQLLFIDIEKYTTEVLADSQSSFSNWTYAFHSTTPLKSSQITARTITEP